MRRNSLLYLVYATLVIISAASVCSDIFARNNNLYCPRIGDKYSRQIISGIDFPIFVDGDTINLTKGRYVDDLHAEVYPPSRLDSVSSFITSEDNSFTYFTTDSINNLYLNKIFKPGVSMIFNSYAPYLTNDTMVLSGITDIVGYVNGIGESHRKGRWSCATMNSNLITPENDTLCDMYSTAMVVCDTLFINTKEKVDTTLHTGKTRRWYQPGYRYPVLEMNETMIMRGNDTIDNLRQCFYFSIEEQLSQISDDEDNEKIREEYAPVHKNIGKHSGQSFNDEIDVTYAIHENEVDIRMNSSTPFEASICVSDIQGRVWHYSSISTATGYANTKIDVSMYRYGVYLVSIMSNDNSVATFKIVR